MEYSQKQGLVYEAVAHSCMHPTSEEVYTILSDAGKRIGLATVYRILQSLVNQKKICRIELTRGDRYDAATGFHGHIICIACGKVTDFDCADIKPSELEGNKIESVQITVKGLCQNCRNN